MEPIAPGLLRRPSAPAWRRDLPADYASFRRIAANLRYSTPAQIGRWWLHNLKTVAASYGLAEMPEAAGDADFGVCGA